MAETDMQSEPSSSHCATNYADMVSSKTFACVKAKREMLTSTA